VVVGAGAVGTRKINGLLACGAMVTVVSLDATAHVQSLVQDGDIIYHCRAYRQKDLAGAFLVIGATNNGTLNRQIYEDAEKQQLLCNIADQPALCNFILPAVVRRGDLVIAISTSGKSPAFAKKMRRDLEGIYGREYAEILELMGAIRKKLLAADHAPEVHKPLFNALIDGGLLEMIRTGRHQALDALLAEVLGAGYNRKSLLRSVEGL
jgi:precorrin-2 dehydrogenase/sirohydrochlorin ferrochelatase